MINIKDFYNMQQSVDPYSQKDIVSRAVEDSEFFIEDDEPLHVSEFSGIMI